MFSYIEKLLHDPIKRNIAINTIGNYLNVFFTALFALILVRIMSPAEYGVLSVLLGVTYVFANILDFGTTATIYSQVPVFYESKDPRMYQFIKTAFFFQSIFSICVIITLFLFFPYFDSIFFKTGVEKWVLFVTTFSILLFIWQNFIGNIFAASKKFLASNIYINIANIVKTLTLLFFWYIGNISVGTVIFTFGIVGPTVYFMLATANHTQFIPKLYSASIKKEEFQFKYTFTYFLSSQFYNLGLRMDLFLLSYFMIGAGLGHYGLAQKIILTIITSIVSITQVLSPGFAAITSKKEAKIQIQKAFKYLLFPATIFVVLFFTPRFVFQLVFTNNFAETEAITKALALPFILNAIGSVPMLFLLYTVKKPSVILYSNILFFIIISVGSYYLIPSKGVFGPPIAIGLAFIIATLIQTITAWKEYKNLR
ncbi:MAG TPA: oligosaccharide flippase family protein [Candidatus Woesebacteria bacterium]|nr:oligosaccharide flippase family protein [Candidatus Woesebacteria bacterium]